MAGVGELLAGRYRVDAVLEQGSVGPVYLCRDLTIDRLVTLTELSAATADADPGRWASARQRLQTEAQAAGRVTHENVVPVYTLETDDEDNLYLVTAHVAGGTLAGLLAGGPLSTSRALDIAIDVARAVQALAAQEIVHRDIKPENILIDSHGRARLTGLGVAQLPEETLRTGEGTRHPGTPAYMSPEQAYSSGYLDQRSDLYALGLVMYEMLVGRPSVRESVPLDAVHPALPAALVAIVTRLLQPAREDRYLTAQALIDDLTGVRDQDVLNQMGLVLDRVPGRTVLAVAFLAVMLLLVNSINALGRRVDGALGVAAAGPRTATSAYSELEVILAATAGVRRPLVAVSTVDPRAEDGRVVDGHLLTDAYEPDDLVPSSISAWETQRRAFDTPGDVDRLVFLVKAGQGYLVTTSNLAVGVDTRLEVQVDGGVLSNDDVAPGTLASQVRFTARADGTAQVTVINQDQYGPDKTYDISLILVEVQPTSTMVPGLPTATLVQGGIVPPRATAFPGGVLATSTLAPRATWTPASTVTLRPTSTLGASLTPQATITRRPTWTRVPTWTPRPTSTLTPSGTPTLTLRPTGTGTATATATATITPTATGSITVTATPTPTQSQAPTVTSTPAATATLTATPTATATLSTFEPTRIFTLVPVEPSRRNSD